MCKVSYMLKLIFLIKVAIFKGIYYDPNLKFLCNIIKPILLLNFYYLKMKKLHLLIGTTNFRIFKISNFTAYQQ